MSKQYEGGCSCGAVRVDLKLPAKIDNYAQRECDCKFCQTHNGAYVSDPAGTLRIVTNHPLVEVKQGDEIAIMFHCAKCNDLISAAAALEGGLRGNVRAGLLPDAGRMQAAVPISPWKLPPTEKIARWNELWMPVTIEQAR